MEKNKNNTSLDQRRPNLTKRLFLVACMALIIVGGLVILDVANKIDLPGFPDKKLSQSSNSNNNINYGPPTEQEKKETENFKNNKDPSDKSTAPPAQTSTGKVAVTPIISSWGQNPQTGAVEVSGFVPGIFEDGGQCTAKLSNNSKVVEQSLQAVKSAQNVSCSLITIPKDKLGTGKWSINLTYSSTQAEGSSNQSIDIEIK